MNDWPFAGMTDTAKALECFETPEWAVGAVLDVELLTNPVIDPCCGQGVMAKAAEARGYEVMASDIHDWRYGFTGLDFLSDVFDVHMGWNGDKTLYGEGFSVFMNPPFSKAVEFVERAHEIGARKIVCFQRFAWWESSKREDFWAAFPQNRIYICANRADCWRIDIPPEERKSSSPTAHAWFVWERGHPVGTLVGHIRKASK